MSKHLIYTDGACSGNPGPGGWGVYWVRPDGQEVEFGGAKSLTTNNEMELTAVVEALGRLETEDGEIEIHTDSQYVQKGMNEWIEKWERNGWKNAERKPVANVVLWQKLLELSRARGDGARRAQFFWVRGHAGHEGNERADQIARRSLEEGIDSGF